MSLGGKGGNKRPIFCWNALPLHVSVDNLEAVNQQQQLEQQLFVQAEYVDRRVTVNVSGDKYQVNLSTLRQFPSTLLGGPGLEEYYDPNEDDFFFDRNRDAFVHIFDFYRTGRLYVPKVDDIPGELFQDELEFFGLASTMEEINAAPEEEATRQIHASFLRRVQALLWEFFDNPQSSLAAQAWAWMDIGFIFISVASMFVETTPPIPILSETDPRVGDTLKYCETITVLYFTVDLILRGLACPSFPDYIKSPLTWVDTFAVSPFYVELFFPDNSDQFAGLRVLRVARVMRVLKLIRRSKKLMTIATVMKNCVSELFLLIVIWTMGVIVFAMLMYTFEENTNSKIESVFDAMWWAVVTMSTVGYGDITPLTVMGKLIGTVVVFLSMVFLALPLTIIVSTFSKVYGNRSVW
ncbi:potassium voltage-gated channel subfamily C member 3-like isoform X1 [Bolinopsis microptera]|uniref:potassium voltage-gated channel subfamily C member 3-like isoform X1 n=1 Tax=Bolinopsis microptera TaxID=2820187 RepID=UPI00307A1762